MGQNPRDPRLVLDTAGAPKVAPTVPPGDSVLRVLRSPLAGWASGILVFVALGFACLDLAPWSLSLLPLLGLAAFLAVRGAEEWPRVGFPACVLGVSLFTVSAGLFRAGVGWAREWDALRHTGSLGTDPGASPVLGVALAVALGGSFLGVLFLHGDTVWRALSSIRLAVTTLAAVGILSVIGTMVVQRFGAGGLPEPEKQFVEKFMKGQGAIPVNARFMVSPPEVRLSGEELAKISLTGAAFGEGKARQMRMGLDGFREKGLKAMAIEKHVEARREHLLRLFQRLETLGFTNVFRTWWFNSLLVLLFVQVVAVIVKRYPWGGWTGTGWVMTHVGVLVVLAGFVISDALLKDGSLALAPGETSEQFEEYTRLDARGKPALTDLGYRVRMLGTDQSFYHELQVAFPSVRAGDDVLWTQEQLRPGRTFRVNDPETKASYEVRIREAWERAVVETAMVSAKSVGRPGGVPALRVRYLHQGSHGNGGSDGTGHVVDEGYLFADGQYTGRLPGYVVQYRRADTAEEAKALLDDGSALRGRGKHGTLRVRPPGVADILTVPATPGEKASATAEDGTSWTVEVRRYHPSYWVGRKPAEGDGGAEEWPDKPALEVEVRRAAPGGGESSGAMVVYADPQLQSQWEAMVKQAAAARASGGEEAPHGTSSRMGAGPAAEASYRYDFAPAVQTWIVEGPGIERTLVVHRRGAPSETRDFSKPGASFPLGAQGLSLALVEAVPDAVPDLRIQPLPQETDAEYLETCLRTLETGVEPPPTVAVARIEVEERDGAGTRTRDEWLVAERKGVMRARNFHSTDGRLVLVMAETNNAMMFRSAMEVQSPDGKPIVEDGKPVRTVVRVNHPLQWGGYAFYQNSFIPATSNGPAASVFRVKYDRGIPTIYTGFAVLTLGVCVLLYLNPVLRSRRRTAGDAAEAGKEVARA